MSGSGDQTRRERIGWLLVDGVERSPAMIAAQLGISAENARTLVRRMVAAGEIATRGDGWYGVTEATQAHLAARVVRRGPEPRPVAEIVVRHLEHLHRRGLRPSTIAQRRQVLARLEGWLRGQGVERVDAT